MVDMNDKGAEDIVQVVTESLQHLTAGKGHSHVIHTDTHLQHIALHLSFFSQQSYLIFYHLRDKLILHSNVKAIASVCNNKPE
jgi:hypothetical protein